jgi:eukaryotic-like serine/threonine-protein kinase
VSFKSVSGFDSSEEVKSFGSFRLDTVNHCLWRDAERVSITPKAYDVLRCLVENSGRLVTPDEMLEAIWTDTYVNPEVLRKYILEIRKALGDKPDDPQFVETVPKRGYRFIARVCAGSESATSDAAEATLSSTTEAAAPESAADDRQLAPPPSSGPTSLTRSGTFWRVGALFANDVPARVKGMHWMVTVLALVIGLFAVSSHFYLHGTAKLTDKDTIVLADFANSTGDAVFDDTLKTALAVSLDQSPFLDVLPDNKVATTLKLMTRPVDTRITPDVARELCMRAGSTAYVAGSIASLGSEYVIGLKVVNCQNGDPLAQEQVTAAAKEKVLDQLGKAASKLRGELGESLASVQKFDMPLEQATTSSLESLRAFTAGGRAMFTKGPTAALEYDQRAIQLDPNFAMAYGAVAGEYGYLGEVGRAGEYYSKAFELREHTSEVERLFITAGYYHNVTGELQRAAQAYQEISDSFPRIFSGYHGLSVIESAEGRYEDALQLAYQFQRRAPNRADGYVLIANAAISQRRFDAVRQGFQQAQARNLNDFALHAAHYGLAFLESDSRSLTTEQRWFAEDPATENYGLSLDSDTEAYAGQIDKARKLTEQAVESAVRADSKENGAILWENAALREAAIGNSAASRSDTAAGVTLYPQSKGVQVEAALSYAMIGDTTQAQKLARDLNQQHPVDTQVQSLWLPAINAQMALNRKRPEEAIEQLQSALPPIEFGTIPFIGQKSCLYPTYIRGEAYLAARQGAQAAAEFQKILDHSGIVWNCWTGALARLGVARANALQARTSQGADAGAARVRALAAYKDFLAVWKDADPGIPILKQSQAEYARLE